MSIRFFSGKHGSGGAGRPARESQQALVLRLLREANGATVSFDRLRDAGVELPASVVSELELAGIPIEHRYEAAAGSPRRPGVRLNPALDPERQAPDDERQAPDDERQAPDPERQAPDEGAAAGVEPPPQPRAAAGWHWTAPSELTKRLIAPFAELRRPARALEPIALVGAIIVVAAVVVIALEASGGGSHHAARHHLSKPRPHPAVVARGAQSPRRQTPATPVSATPVSPALATEFEAQGHDLLESGQYGKAVPVLRRALAATGMRLSDCLEPANETCLTYAYALYDLGRALELSGDPTAALPVLEQRLQIDNQRDVVAAELAHVRTIIQP